VKFLDEFRSGDAVRRLVEGIETQAEGRQMTFMEVCGTHTMAIAMPF
jgi:hydrogenase maturation factor